MKALLHNTKKDALIKGTIILSLTGIISKFLGFYNRIFLTGHIGVKELGIYQLVFPIYLLCFSICAHGISQSLTRHISAYCAKEKYTEAKYAFKYGIKKSFWLACLATLFLYIFSEQLCLYVIKNSDCVPLLKIIAFSLPFVCIKACVNSVFLAMGKNLLHGLMHLVEQIFRITTIFLASISLINIKIDASLAAASMVSGELFSTLFSLIAFIILLRSNKGPFYIKGSSFSYISHKDRKNVKNTITPDIRVLSTNSILQTLFQSFEAILLPSMLFKFYQDNDIVMELFGSISGVVIPFILFPATITSALSTVLLSTISAEYARGNLLATKKCVITSSIICVLTGVFSAAFYRLFGEYFCILLFKSPMAGMILKKICILCPIIYLSQTLQTVLIGMNKSLNVLTFYIISISIRILFILLLVPVVGVMAFILGMLVSYTFLLIAIVIQIKCILC